MANEINVAVSFSANKNGAVLSQNLAKQADMAGDEMTNNVQIVGTATEAIAVGDVTTIGYVLFKNLDTTNFVELSTDNANADKFAKLLPGDLTLIKASSATIYATANTANVKVLVMAAEL